MAIREKWYKTYEFLSVYSLFRTRIVAIRFYALTLEVSLDFYRELLSLKVCLRLSGIKRTVTRMFCDTLWCRRSTATDENSLRLITGAFTAI